MRLAIPLTILVFAAALMAGCGGSSSNQGSSQGSCSGAPIGASAKSCETGAVDAEGLRATGVSCNQARRVMYGWQRQDSCALPSGASRGGCLARSYRCQAVRSGRGLAISCARPGQSVAFIAKR